MKYISNLKKTFSKNVKSLAIMGSTGTIGQNSLAIIRNAPELFQVTALAAGKNINLLVKDALEFQPQFLAVQHEQDIDRAYQTIKAQNANYTPHIVHGQKGYAFLASLDEIDTVLSAQVGAAGLRATVAAAEAGKTICLANKESLVLAGDLIKSIAQKSNALILPVDSEHYAIFQCLHAQLLEGNTHSKNLKKIILTASGGPFRGKSNDFLKKVTKNDALAHPNWNMGAKISIDSATLMNKGLEVIEAAHLYGLDLDKIDVIVHPQSIIHSMVEWCDGSIIAQLASPDMRLPIGACLAYPKLLDANINTLSPLDFTKQNLSFELPDTQTFPCLDLAKQAFKEKLCVELNASNEIAVDLFLKERISFTQIPMLIKKVLEQSSPSKRQANTSTEEKLLLLEERDMRARDLALSFI